MINLQSVAHDFKSFAVNFINILHARFLYERLFSSYILALNELSYKKRASKMLMKLTTEQFSGINI